MHTLIRIVSLSSLVLLAGTRLLAQNAGFLSAGYDTRFGDIYELGAAGEKAFFSAGFGGILLKDTFKSASNQSDSAFNSRYGSAAFPANVASDLKTQVWQLSAGYFFTNNGGGASLGGCYAGIGYTALTQKSVSRFAMAVPGLPANTTATGDYSAGSLDLFLGYMMVQKGSFFFDLRGGYGALATEKLDILVNSQTVGSFEKPKLLDPVYFKIAIGWSW